MRWNVQINAAAVVAAVLLVLLSGVLVARAIRDARRHRAAQAIERQLRGALSESERRVRRVRSGTGQGAVADRREGRVDRRRRRRSGPPIKRELGERDLTIRRLSNAAFELRARIDAAKAETEAVQRDDGRIEYTFRNAWLAFSTPNVFASGGETIELFGIHPRVRIAGFEQEGGLLQTETIELSFFDADGAALPFETELVRYDLDYVPLVPKSTEPTALDRIHLDLFGHAAIGVPVEPLYIKAAAGAELNLWNVSVLAWGEADTDWSLRLMAGVGGRWRAF